MRIVCDTNCLISGVLWTGAPARILKRVVAGSDALFTSQTLLHELARVLEYARVSKVSKVRGLRSADLLRCVVISSTLGVRKPLLAVAIVTDPEGDKMLACTVSVVADAIVSGDGHLLDLATFGGIPVLTRWHS